MNGKNIELTRRRVLGGLVTVGAASAAAGAGTFAVFSDSETSEGNTVTAGTLDLTDENQNNGPYQIVDASGKPGWSNTSTQTLRNDGSVAGELSLTIDSITESSGSNPEPEENAGDSNNDPDLAEFLDVTLTFDGEDVWSGKASTLSEDQSLTLGSLAGSTEKDLQITVSIPTDGDDINGGTDINIIQGDSVTINATFDLTQSSS